MQSHCIPFGFAFVRVILDFLSPLHIIKNPLQVEILSCVYQGKNFILIVLVLQFLP